jgi:hypothetical protein
LAVSLPNLSMKFPSVFLCGFATPGCEIGWDM